MNFIQGSNREQILDTQKVFRNAFNPHFWQIEFMIRTILNYYTAGN